MRDQTGGLEVLELEGLTLMAWASGDGDAGEHSWMWHESLLTLVLLLHWFSFPNVEPLGKNSENPDDQGASTQGVFCVPFQYLQEAVVFFLQCGCTAECLTMGHSYLTLLQRIPLWNG